MSCVTNDIVCVQVYGGISTMGISLIVFSSDANPTGRNPFFARRGLLVFLQGIIDNKRLIIAPIFILPIVHGRIEISKANSNARHVNACVVVYVSMVINVLLALVSGLRI